MERMSCAIHVCQAPTSRISRECHKLFPRIHECSRSDAATQNGWSLRRCPSRRRPLSRRRRTNSHGSPEGAVAGPSRSAERSSNQRWLQALSHRLWWRPRDVDKPARYMAVSMSDSGFACCASAMLAFNARGLLPCGFAQGVPGKESGIVPFARSRVLASARNRYTCPTPGIHKVRGGRRRTYIAPKLHNW